MKRQKCLITGAAGFIAPYVIKEFKDAGFDVIALDKFEPKTKISGVEYIRKDVRDVLSSDLKGVDIVGHFAFLTNIPFSISSPVSTTDENIGMTIRLLQASTEAGVRRFLYPSTASLYGNNPIPWTEDLPGDPIEPYSFQKLASESLLRMWTKRYGLETATLRLFQVYAENPRSDGVLSIFMKAKKEGTPITLTETAKGSMYRTARRDFVHLADVAKAFLAAANCDDLCEQGPIFNIATGIPTEIEDVAKIIGGKTIFIPQRSYEVECHQADLSKTERVLNWRAKINFKQWLSEFVKSSA
ncbi:NAD-dependent epimerase/dehydratase family protein [bacterium]|nr:NAD-dependent epimerase/dehydratase family protein [bacterium]